MKGKNLLFLLVPLSVCVLLTINACRKTDRDEDKETQSSTDNITAQEIFNDVFKQVAYYANADSVFKLAAAACDTSWVTGATFPKTLNIKFDSISGCTDALGVNHKGKLKAVLTQKLTDSLSVVTVSFNGFYRNGYLITGTQTITNKGSINGAPTYAINVANASLTTPTGKIIIWNAQLTYKLIAGETTSTFADDVLTITGTSNGTVTKGEGFKTTVNAALRFELACTHLTSGTFTITPGSLTPRSVDLGNGACDNSAVVTLTGKSYTITLP
jgi:hypothetical protein